MVRGSRTLVVGLVEAVGDNFVQKWIKNYIFCVLACCAEESARGIFTHGRA